MRDRVPVSGLQEPAASLEFVQRGGHAFSPTAASFVTTVFRGTEWPGIAATLPKKGGRRRSLAGCIASDTATGLQAVTAPEAAGTRASAAGAAHEAETVLFGPFSLRTRLLEKNGVPVKLGTGNGYPATAA